MTERYDDELLDGVAVQWGVAPVLAVLDHDAAALPSAGERRSVLDRAARTPRRGAEPLDPVELHRRQVAAMRRVLDGLSAHDWDRPTACADWTVHALVAHLLVVERYTSVHFGLPAPPVELADRRLGRDDDNIGLGTATIARELRRPPEATAAAWAVAARRLADHVRSAAYRPDASAPLYGRPYSQSSALVARSFELWSHADDIRRATGRCAEIPTERELRTLSAFWVGGLPYLVQLRHPNAQVVPARIVLTGAGGGTYDVGGDGEPVALLVADVVDFCRLVAGRIQPAALVATRQGDGSVIESLLSTASGLAR